MKIINKVGSIEYQKSGNLELLKESLSTYADFR